MRLCGVNERKGGIAEGFVGGFVLAEVFIFEINGFRT